MTRVFDAPVEMVWKAWTMPEHYKKWWGPKDFSCPIAKIDFRVGGKQLSCMRGAGPDGKVHDFWSTGTYKEIVPLKKIVVSDSFADETGKIVPASYYGMPSDFPMNMEVTLAFEKIGNKTKMTMRHVGMPKSMMTDANAGWSTSFDKLDAMLKKK
ncbi:MAG: SRPBCC domain-containing protein [archaeon]|nr:SRPBCC domain-containing protein [archaeon]